MSGPSPCPDGNANAGWLHQDDPMSPYGFYFIGPAVTGAEIAW